MSYFFNEYKNFYDVFLETKKEKIEKYIVEKNIVEEEIKKFNENINLLFEKIQENNGEKFLVAGYVQGGKTDFTIGFNSKLIDYYKNKKNIFIHLTSSNTKLFDQNHQRFETFFNNKKIDKSRTLLMKKNRKIDEDFENVIEDNDNFILFFMKEKTAFKKINEIICTLKKHLNSNEFNIFIIDDEGDNASFNTKDNSSISQYEKSTIFNYLSNILNENKKECFIKYISITATPMIHLFAHENHDLKPDYAFVLNKNYGYTGIEEFINESNKSQSKLFNIINEIDEGEKNEFEREELIKSIILFFIKVLFINEGKIEIEDNSQPIMIINIDIKKIIQERWKEFVEEELNFLFKHKEIFEDKMNKWNITHYLHNELQKEIEDNKIENNEIVKEIINNFKNRYKIILFNSDNKNKEDEDFENYSNYLRIVIGGYRMSRGITFKNLLQAFIWYKPKIINADNVMQQCRWFGYRNKYLKHISLFLNKDFLEIYNDLLSLEQDLYEQIAINQRTENNKFSKIKPFLKLSENPYKNIFGTYKGRAKQKRVSNLTFSTHIIKNNFKMYQEDEFFFIKEKFDNFKSKNKDEYGFTYLEFKTFEEFVNYFFDKGKPLEIYFGNNIKKIKEKLYSLNQTTIIRFIDSNDSKERIITGENDGMYYWGNGTYKSSNIGLDQSEINYIDILPLKIYKNKNDLEKFEKDIYRLRLNLNKKLIEEISEEVEGIITNNYY